MNEKERVQICTGNQIVASEILRILMIDYFSNRIYNKILDRDWFSARLFVT